MAKLCGGSRKPPQGMLPVLLLFVVASIQAGPVVAWDLPLNEHDLEVGAHLVGRVAERLTLGKLSKINKGWKDFSNGWKQGSRLERKAVRRQNPGPGGSSPATSYTVDTVVVVTPPGGGPGARFRVLTADITARSAARIGFCAVGAVGPRRQYSNINLLGASNQGAAVALGLGIPATLEECPAAASGGAWAVLGLGRGGDLSTRFPTFSFLVTSNGLTVVSVPTAPQPQQAGRKPGTSTTPLSYSTTNGNDGLYYVQITGIQVDWLSLQAPTTEVSVRPYGTDLLAYAYLNNTERYTYLESGVYDRLKVALMLQIHSLNPGATLFPDSNQLCYVGLRVGSSFPRIAIVFAGNAVMELRVDNAWYAETPSSPICLAILPTPYPVSIIGSWLQSGRTMTIDLKAGAHGTLTF